MEHHRLLARLGFDVLAGVGLHCGRGEPSTLARRQFGEKCLQFRPQFLAGRNRPPPPESRCRPPRPVSRAIPGDPPSGSPAARLRRPQLSTANGWAPKNFSRSRFRPTVTTSSSDSRSPARRRLALDFQPGRRRPGSAPHRASRSSARAGITGQHFGHQAETVVAGIIRKRSAHRLDGPGHVLGGTARGVLGQQSGESREFTPRRPAASNIGPPAKASRRCRLGRFLFGCSNRRAPLGSLTSSKSSEVPR